MYEVCPHCARAGKRVVLFERIGNVAVIRPSHNNSTSYLVEGSFTAQCGPCGRPTTVAQGQVIDGLLTTAVH